MIEVGLDGTIYNYHPSQRFLYNGHGPFIYLLPLLKLFAIRAAGKKPPDINIQ
jgi:hypothetical protein